MVWVRSWIESLFSNRLDPDPDSTNIWIRIRYQ
jgi:hypothetical protein